MANVIQFPGAAREPVTQQRLVGRYPKQVPSLLAVRRAEYHKSEASKRETIEALEWMLQEAKRGKLPHMLAIFDFDGREVSSSTGRFKADSNEAVYALGRFARAISDATR